jgi:hypothetical protein
VSRKSDHDSQNLSISTIVLKSWKSSNRENRGSDGATHDEMVEVIGDYVDIIGGNNEFTAF